MTSKLKLGFNDNISNEIYHGDTEYVSSSVLKMILTDPERYYKQYITKEVEPKKSNAFDYGSYVHTLVLEPELEESEYAFYDGAVRRGREYDKIVAENPDKIIILESQKIGAKQLADSVFANPKAAKLLKSGTPEQTLCVKLEGVKVKVRCDYLNGTNIIDLKTTGAGVSYSELVNTCIKYDYDLSAALYVDAFAKHTGEHHDFYFVFASKTTTQCAVVKASEQFIENGRRKYKDALEKLKKARATGVYYDPDEVRELFIPESAVWRSK